MYKNINFRPVSQHSSTIRSSCDNSGTVVLFLLDCELHFLYSSLVNVAEDKGVVQRFALFHRLLDVGCLALGKYVLEEEGRTCARHKAYFIGKR